jgi:hypothetical protein
MSSDANHEVEFNRWRDEAEAIDLVEFVQGRGTKLRRTGAEWIGPCPRCGGHDRFSINTRERVFNCRGFGGGSYIDAVMHIDDSDFLSACEAMTGRPPPERPKRKGRASPRKAPPAPDVAPPARRDEAPPPPRDEAPPPGDGEGRRSQRIRGKAVDLFDGGKSIIGTHAAAYLAARGLSVSPGWTFDLRFMRDLPYYGYADADAEEQTELGVFPALLAAIRNASGDLIGVHRTYLDPAAPRKLSPPGDPARNGVKKILGKMGGGLIRLSEPAPVLVLGEGTETSRSGYEIGYGGDDAMVAAAVSLGNLAGGSAGSLPHPRIARRTIPSGMPDLERPGAVLPDVVEEVIILGDGDSDRPTTLAHLLTAGRRWAAEGRKVFVAMAPEGRDWNDVLREGREAGQ